MFYLLRAMHANAGSMEALEHRGAGTVLTAWWPFLIWGYSLINKVDQQLQQVLFESWTQLNFAPRLVQPKSTPSSSRLFILHDT